MNGLNYNKSRNETELGGGESDCYSNRFNAERRFLHSISLHIVLDTNQNVECFGVLFLHD